MELTRDQIVAYWEKRHPGQRIGTWSKVAVRCAFHNDTNPSCTLFNDGNGGFNCMGCGAKGNLFQFEARFSQCDLQQAELNVAEITGAKPKPRKEGEVNLGPPVDIYDYRDESGAVLFQKRRYEPEMDSKTFRSFHETERGWRAGIDPKDGPKTRRVLFNLPDLVKANVVFVVEGEKCARAVMLANLFPQAGYSIAVTTSFDGAWRPGAKPKWLHTYNPYFTGKQVFIFPDDDEPGRLYAEHIAQSIAPYAFNVRIVELPDLAEGEDIADFLPRHSTDELEKTIQASKTWATTEAANAAPMLEEEAAPRTAMLLDTLKSWILNYVVLSEAQATILAVWILHTYAIDATDMTAYIHITAPEKECGKSRLMKVLSAVASNPIRGGHMTAAVMVRVVDSKQPTLFLDEMDTAMNADREYAESVRGILNEGIERGGMFYKCDGQNHDLRAFSVFGPKCFAGIGKLPETVTSRSIVIDMRRKLPSEVVAPFRQKASNVAAGIIRSELKAWITQGSVARLREIEPAPISGLGDRQNDIAEPLLAIAQLAGEGCLHALKCALTEVFEVSSVEDGSVGVALLRDIRTIFDERGAHHLHSEALAALLCKLEGSPWPEWSRGRGLTVNNLANQLGKFKIHSRDIRDGSVRKGYLRGDFQEVWKRYCPAPALSASAATSLQPAPLLGQTSFLKRDMITEVAVAKDDPNPHESSTVALVADAGQEKAQIGPFDTSSSDGPECHDEGEKEIWV